MIFLVFLAAVFAVAVYSIMYVYFRKGTED